MTSNRDQILAEIAEKDRKHAELLATLEVPSYENRRLEAQFVKSKHHQDDSDHYAITGTSGWTAGCPREVFELLNVGDPYILETRGVTTITGWIVNGSWMARKSDQDIEREHQAFVEASARRHAEYVAQHRDEWVQREAALPDWVADRLRVFHANPAFESEPMGWGYELMVCELAVLYADMGPAILDRDQFTITDSPAVSAFAHVNGTSGAQHGMALALAKRHLRGESVVPAEQEPTR